MVAFNWGTEANGLCVSMAAGAGTITSANSSTQYTLSSATDYANVSVGMVVGMYFTYASTNKYCVKRIASKDGSNKITLDSGAWMQGPTTMSFLYGTPVSLGSITSVNMSLVSGGDIIGMPLTPSTGTLSFPYEGVVRKFKINGFFQDTADFVYGASLQENLEYLESRIQTDQTTHAACFYFRRFTEKYTGIPRLYFVDATGLTYDASAKDKYRFNYTMELVERYT